MGNKLQALGKFCIGKRPYPRVRPLICEGLTAVAVKGVEAPNFFGEAYGSRSSPIVKAQEVIYSNGERSLINEGVFLSMEALSNTKP